MPSRRGRKKPAATWRCRLLRRWRWRRREKDSTTVAARAEANKPSRVKKQAAGNQEEEEEDEEEEEEEDEMEEDEEEEEEDPLQAAMKLVQEGNFGPKTVELISEAMENGNCESATILLFEMLLQDSWNNTYVMCAECDENHTSMRNLPGRLTVPLPDSFVCRD